MTTSKVVLLVALLCLAACSNNKSTEFLAVDLDAATSGSFDINEISYDAAIIRLETNEESLISATPRYAIGQKYVIVVNRDNILQFGIDGSFIRVLARKGRGPGEYNFVPCFAMNPDESRFLIDDGNRSSILVYDLESGNFESAIEKPLAALGLENGFPLEKMIVDDAGVLHCLSENISGNTYIYQQNLSGAFMGSTILSNQEIEGDISRNPYLGHFQGEVHFLSRKVDSVFTITERTFTPYAALNYQEKFVLNTASMEGKGKIVTLMAEGANSFLVDQANNELTPSRFSYERFAVYVDKHTSQAEIMTTLHFRGLEIPMDPMEKVLMQTYLDKVIFPVSADVFKELVQESIDRSTTTLNMREINDQVIETDNPLLIVGILK